MTQPMESSKTKNEVICDIIRAYQHNYDAEGGAITKRRLWYILKPKFRALPSYIVKELDAKTGKTKEVEYLKDMYHHGKPIQVISNADYSKYYNALAKNGEIDDTYISDNSRVMNVGSSLPKIIIAVEKSTVDTVVLGIAEQLGCSCYIAKGFSSIYAAKKLLNGIELTEPYQIEASMEFGELEYTNYHGQPSDSPVIVLNMTDYDKSGLEISDTISDHFSSQEHHRVLLEPSQIPPEMEDQYFTTTDKKVGKAYELDVLNIHQLKDIFLESIPPHISEMITEKHRDDQWVRNGDNRIPSMVERDNEVQDIQVEIDRVHDERSDIEKPFLQEIAELERRMKLVTEELTEEIDKLTLNLHSTSIKVLPKHRTKYFELDNFIKPITVQEMAQ